MKFCIPFLLTFSLLSCNNILKTKQAVITPVADTTDRIPVKDTSRLFGIPVDSYRISTGKIRPNRFLPEILSKYGIDLQEIDILIKNSSKIFNVREIRSGNNYTILSDKDTIGKARYFIYEHDPALFYIFSFNDSLNITPFRQKINSVIRFSSGIIETSLWDAIIENKLSPELANDLSDIYAWTIDFFGLQKGDCFKVIYEEKFIKDQSFGMKEYMGQNLLIQGTRYLPFR